MAYDMGYDAGSEICKALKLPEGITRIVLDCNLDDVFTCYLEKKIDDKEAKELVKALQGLEPRIEIFPSRSKRIEDLLKQQRDLDIVANAKTNELLQLLKDKGKI